ncbi:MAG TPA: ADP-ribosylglycohydrolase family protein [Kofleriaceae bacterium]|nr:ADP-ribosylglycohydrolase family protein [Kofleriaceae bacterium]
MTDHAGPESNAIERLVSEVEPGRALGALLGLAVGDALGTTLEFERLPAPRFPRLAQGPHRSVTGGGPFGVAAGQVTDDTQMAVCLFESLLDRRAVDSPDIARRYVAWSEHAFDVGSQTSAALAVVAGGAPPAAAGRMIWERRGRQAAGNGSLMRTAPIGVLLGQAPRECARGSLVESEITHSDPRCRLACAALNAGISHALARASTPAALVDHMEASLAAAAALLGEDEADLIDEVNQAHAALRRDLDAARAPDPELYGPELHIHEQQGFVRVAFRLAAWELVHAPTYEAALIDVVNRGGDADTNGAITGALLGAFHSVEAIPRAWLAAVVHALEGPHHADPLLATELHPRAFITGLEQLYGRPLLPRDLR